jgi:hypothetical protein
VRDHVNKLRAAGMPLWAIEQRFGMSANHLDHLLWGSWGESRFGPSAKVRTETAQMLLAYWPVLDDFPDQARIDSTGTRRRLQALQVRGFNLAAVARKTGNPVTYFQKAVNKEKVTARLARAVRDVYGIWWNADPIEHGVKEWVAERTRHAARRAGWYGPLAWDDDTIDDRSAVPQTDAVPPVATEGGNVAARWLMGEAVILDRDARREVLQHLFEWTNDSTAEIAAQMEMTPVAAERQWERMKERAAAEGRRLWRRVYVPRERDLTQNEMEEAA